VNDCTLRRAAIKVIHPRTRTVSCYSYPI
jgi:hypothetical protein